MATHRVLEERGKRFARALLLLGTVFGACSLGRAEDPPPFLTLFGRAAGGAGQPAGPAELWCPWDVAIDSHGDVFVVDGHYDRIAKFDRFGTWLGSFGTHGSGNGEFDGPWAIAIGPGDEIFVTDYWNFRVQVFDRAGNYLRQWGGTVGSGPGEFWEVAGIDVDPVAGVVYVADGSGNAVHRFDLSGTFLGRWTWFDSTGYVPFSPVDVAVEASGEILVLDANLAYSQHSAVLRFTPGGTLVAQWGAYQDPPGEGEFASPFRVTLDAFGDVYVSDVSANWVQKFRDDGSFVWRTDETRREGWSTLLQPAGLAIGGEVLYLTEAESSGQTVQLFGTAPFSLAIDVPDLFEADQFTSRTFAGVPQQLALLFVLELNGAPFVQRLASGGLDADGTWTFEATVPPGLSGNSIRLACFSRNAQGKIAMTNPAEVTFD